MTDDSLKEEILINVTPSEVRAALLENGVLQEVYIERAARRGLISNIYKGRVLRVLPGMQAAFIDIGLERTAFLHASDIARGGEAVATEAIPGIRELVREELPEATEEIKWGRPVYSLNHIVCYLAASTDHANLGFYRGIELPDPHGLLEGEGKKLRHIKVYKREEIRRQWYRTLIRQAARLDND